MKQQICVLCASASSFAVCERCYTVLPKQTRRCLSCATKLYTTSNYCTECLLKPPYMEHTWALYDYEAALPYLIKQFKYQRQLSIGAFFAREIGHAYESIVRHSGQYDVIIPMPLHYKRIRERGFNQVLELLAVVSNKYPNQIDYQLCGRIKETPKFAHLNLVQRKRHIKNAFDISHIRAKHILIVDDVMTTGASLNELAKSIKSKNTHIISVDALCLARAVLN